MFNDDALSLDRQNCQKGNSIMSKNETLARIQEIGLLAVAKSLLSVSAYHYSKEDIGRADYTFMMPRRPQIYLNLDLKQMGVGGVDSWTPNAYPLESYRIRSDQPHTYQFRLTPVSGDFSSLVN